MPVEITTPVGRIVWGHPTKARPKTDDNNRPVLNDQGQPVQQWSFGVAFEKSLFQQTIWPVMFAEAQTLFPNGTPPAFAWKYVDGDGIDSNGQPFNQREGYAGNIVLSISSTLMAPPLYKDVGGRYDQLPEDAIKCGDYVVCGLEFIANKPASANHKPSLFVNPKAIQLVGYGTEIITKAKVDPNAVFGGKTYQLPPGASLTPIAPTSNVGMPGMNAPMGMQQPAPMGMQQPAPMGMQQPAPMGMQQPAPHYGVTGVQPQQGMPGMMPPR